MSREKSLLIKCLKLRGKAEQFLLIALLQFSLALKQGECFIWMRSKMVLTHFLFCSAPS